MFIDEGKAKSEIVEVGRRLYYKGFVAGNDGNISFRINDNEILITPTGVSKGFMSEDEIVKVNFEGKIISGHFKPTSEIKMHIAAYKKRSDVFAVVHAHPPKATAFAITGVELNKITLPEVIFTLGAITLSEYGTPSTDEIPRNVSKCIDKSDAILLSNHGALTVGKDLMDAYYKMETLEHFAEISIYTRLLGNERVLSKEQTDELFRVRTEVFGKPRL